jgi:hypothetical protein
MQTLLGTVHHLINAVNGLDPAMPPVQALIALNKIKSQVAASGQGGGGQQPTVAAKDVSGIMSMINGALSKRPTAMPESSVSPAPAEALPAADAGVAQLPSHFNFDGGGIVAFAGGTDENGVVDSGLLPVPEKSQSTAGAALDALGLHSIANYLSENKAKQRMYNQAQSLSPGLFESLTPTERANRTAAVSNINQGAQQGLGIGAPISDPSGIAAIEAKIAQTNPVTNQTTPAAPAAPPTPVKPQVSPVVPGAPQGQRPAGIPMPPQASTPPPLGAGGQFLANQLNATEPVGSTYEERQKKYYDEHPELKKPAMSDLEKHLAVLEQNDQEAKKDREKREAMRNVSDFFHNLSMAGRASAGQTGIGALLGNYGQVSHQSAMDALDRQDKYEQADRDHAINMVKYQSEIENARRAESRGDFTAAEAARARAEEYALKLKENKVQAASALARDETSVENDMRNRQSQETIARENRLAQIAIHTMPGAEQNMVDKYIADYMHKNPGTSYSQGYDAFKQAPSSEKTDVASLKSIIDPISGYTKEQRAAAQQKLQELAGLSGASGAPSVPQGAIDALKANPSLRQAFEQKYHVPASIYLGK